MISRLLYMAVLYGAAIAVSAQNNSCFQYYHTIPGLDTSQQEIMKAYHFAEAKLIDGRYIDPNRTEKLDSASLAKSIKALYPSTTYTGIGVLDWEGTAYNDMYTFPASHRKFKAAMAEFQKMIRIARQVRPKIKWGIYGIPYVSYWKRDDAWKNNYKKIMPLLKNVDVFMPSLYDYYEDGTPSTNNEAYFLANTQLALEAGNTAKKPVYAFLWHRWFDGNEKVGLQLIPEKQFSKNLDIILNARHGNTRITGIIWFDSPKYFYQIKPQLASMDARSMNMSNAVEDKLELEDSIIEKYAALMTKRVKKRKR